MPDLPPAPQPGSHLGEVARVFLKLGFTAFGGPAAHIALMEEELVTRRRWLDRQHFLDMVSAVNFVPGPNSTELAIHLGLIRAGFPGLVVAGVCFIVPAMLIVLPLAYLYLAYGARPGVGGALIGIKACMLAIVGVALWRFAVTGIKDRFTAAVAVAAALAAWLCKRYAVPQQELVILAAAAVAGIIWYRHRPPAPPPAADAPPPPAAPAPRAPAVLLPIAFAASGASSQMLQMTLFFLKVGATLFGSGYVLASFLHTGLVEQHRWLSVQELLDAIAVGQVTPGPLLTAATFIGYLLGARTFGGGVPGGVAGGTLATLAIFLPSFLFICVLGPLLPRLRANPRARAALDGMNAAVVALIAVVTVWLARSALTTATGRVDGLPVALFAASLALMLFTRVNATWVILACAVAGVVVRGWG
jgi:chromate transporter